MEVWKRRLTDVILADVNSFNTSSQSYIYPIIDKERDIGRFGDSMKSLCNTNLLSSVAGLVTQLDNCDACQNVRSSDF